MKKLLAILCILAVLGGISYQAIAEDDHDHEHVEHYEGQEFKNADDALATLNEKNGEIAEILKADKLTGSQFEKIHEISYTLEDAVDALKEKKAGAESKLDTIDEAVQALHHASENHEEAKVREWFAKLDPAAGNIKADSVKQAAAEKGVYEITIKDHTFIPDEIRVPAGEKIKLVVHNKDATPEEFESDDFRREKIIAGNSSATIFVGPLEPGKYHFFGEFNLDKANGYLIAE